MVHTNRTQLNDFFFQFRVAFLDANVDQLVDLYLEESIFFDVDGEVRGLKDIAEKFRAFFDTFRVTEYEVLEREENLIGDDHAYAIMRFRSTAQLVAEPSAPPLEFIGRSTEVMKRVNGDWYFLVDHASFPVKG